MDKKLLIPASPNPQVADGKSDMSKVPSSSATSTSQDSNLGVKKKRERSPLRIPNTSRVSIRQHVVVPRDGAIGFSCGGIGMPVGFVVARHKKETAPSKSTDIEPETETDEEKPPTCTKPKREDGEDYYESLSNAITASIKSVESSPPSKTFWEETGAIPKHLKRESTKTPPKALPPFRKQTPTKSKIKTELFPDVPVEKSEQKYEEPPKSSPSSSTETNSPPRSLPKSRSDFEDNFAWVRYNCLDFQDYKRTVNNRQKGVENSLSQLLPLMISAKKDAQCLATKITKVGSEVCDKEGALRIQNDKLKYLVGRTLTTISKIDDLFERYRTDFLAYATLTTEGNEGIDMRLKRLLMALCGLSDEDLSKEKNTIMREAFSEEGTETAPGGSNT